MSEFFYWYLSEMPRDILTLGRRYVGSGWQFFNPPLLMQTLVAPWKRDRQSTDGYPLGQRLAAAIENLMSRFLGAVVRLVTAGVAMILALIESILVLIAFLVWFLVPFVAIALIGLGVRILL
ncbi:MAG: hypothetical protein HY707_14350 [Ignavibacteriae bacterium]|nr:hypothetical protein [Ignavibacteriota bacterium]